MFLSRGKFLLFCEPNKHAILRVHSPFTFSDWFRNSSKKPTMKYFKISSTTHVAPNVRILSRAAVHHASTREKINLRINHFCESIKARLTSDNKFGKEGKGTTILLEIHIYLRTAIIRDPSIEHEWSMDGSRCTIQSFPPSPILGPRTKRSHPRNPDDDSTRYTCHTDFLIHHRELYSTQRRWNGFALLIEKSNRTRFGSLRETKRETWKYSCCWKVSYLCLLYIILLFNKMKRSIYYILYCIF